MQLNSFTNNTNKLPEFTALAGGVTEQLLSAEPRFNGVLLGLDGVPGLEVTLETTEDQFAGR